MLRYYICSTYICGFAAMAYFAMLSGQGWTAIAGCRQFFYARSAPESLHWAHSPGSEMTRDIVDTRRGRFADYIVTMPLLILLLGQVAAADIATIAATIGAACK